MRKIIIGSRGSALALAQSEEVARRLESRFSELKAEIRVIHTKGDQILDRPIAQIGSKGVFTQEIEQALRHGEIDLAVHSMKDMPSTLPKGLMFAGSPTPSSPYDVLVLNHGYRCWQELPQGARIGTGSLRRAYQLKKMRPDVQIVGLRGNVGTRLNKMKSEKLDAIVLAHAGLLRLHWEEKWTLQLLSDEEMIPACAQGILALEVKEDTDLLPYLEAITDKEATLRMQVERMFLNTIGGDCHVPIGAHVIFAEDHWLLHALYGKEDGSVLCIRHEKLPVGSMAGIVQVAKEMKAEVEGHG